MAAYYVFGFDTYMSTRGFTTKRQAEAEAEAERAQGLWRWVGTIAEWNDFGRHFARRCQELAAATTREP